MILYLDDKESQVIRDVFVQLAATGHPQALSIAVKVQDFPDADSAPVPLPIQLQPASESESFPQPPEGSPPQG